MKNLKPLDKAIEEKIVLNSDKMDPNALFHRGIKKVYLNPDETGMGKAQVIYRQDFDYTFFKIREKGQRDTKYYMVAVGGEENRNSEVSLRGYIGAMASMKGCFIKLGDLYDNSETGISAVGYNRKKVLELILKRNKTFKGFKFATWLNKREQYGYNQMFIRGRNINSIELYNQGFINSASFDYCPLIEIFDPSKILVVLKSKKKNGKWKLIPRSNLLLRLRYGLFGLF